MTKEEEHGNNLYEFALPIVFSTKERRPMITAPIQSELYPYLGGIVRDKEGIHLEIGGTADHVHIFAKLKQHIAIADILRELKANSSKLLNERPDLGQWYGWQTGYGAFTVSQIPGACAPGFMMSPLRGC